MRVLPTNTTTPRYNNKYIRVSSRNNFPPIFQPPLSCVPSQTRPSPFILLRATTIVNQHCCNWTCRWIFLSFSPSPSAFPLFSFPLYVLTVKLLPVFCHDFVPMSWHNLCVLLLRNFHLFFRARYVCATFSTKHAKKVRYLQKNPDFLAAA